MSCGCLGSNDSGQEYNRAKENAKKLAHDENKTMAIWQENGEWFIGEAIQAATTGKPIREVFSAN